MRRIEQKCGPYVQLKSNIGRERREICLAPGVLVAQVSFS